MKIGPGEKTAAHGHPANCGVDLTEAIFKLDSGERLESKAGAVDCTDAQSHIAENVGTKPAEVILIEFKNREKFKT